MRMTRGERREEQRRKRGKHGHKTDGASVRVLHRVVLKKAEEAERDSTAR